MTDESNFLMYYEEDASRDPEYRWNGYIICEGHPEIVFDSAYKASKEELQLWFEGWLAGWRSRSYHNEPCDDESCNQE